MTPFIFLSSLLEFSDFILDDDKSATDQWGSQATFSPMATGDLVNGGRFVFTALPLLFCSSNADKCHNLENLLFAS